MRWLIPFFLLFLITIVAIKAHYFSMLVGHGDFWDLDNYIHTVQDIRHGVSPYDITYMQTLGPPLVIAPYIVFSFLSLTTSHMLFMVSSLVSGVVACWLLAKKYLGEKYVLEKTLILIGLLLSAFPTRFTFITGQSGLWMTLLVVVVLSTHSKKIQGIALGLLTIMKTFFAFTILARARSWRLLFWIALTISSTIIICFPIIKPAFYAQYRQQKFDTVMWQPDRIHDLAYYNQSLKTTLSRVGLVDASVPIWISISAVVAVYLIWSQNLPFALLAAVILSPVAWQHYFVELFPLFIFSMNKIAKKPRWLILWIVSFFLWWIEFPWLHQQPINLWTGLLASHYFISAILLGIILVYNHHQHD